MAAIEVDVLADAKTKFVKQLNKVLDDRLNQIYIPPMGGTREEVPENQRFLLLGEVARQLTETPLRSLLLLGHSGMGKTNLSLQFCKFMWDIDSEDTKIPLPLYIYLPQYKRYLQSGLLEQVLRDANLLKTERIAMKSQPLILVLDGFDEVSIAHNLYRTQGWGTPGIDIRILICCRPEILMHKNTIALFEVSEGTLHETIYLQSFNDAQIEAYFREYLANTEEKIEKSDPKGKGKEKQSATHILSLRDYLYWLDRLPSLKALVKTPFLLMVVAQALPSIVQDLSQVRDDEVAQKQFTQNELFRRFLEHWFGVQAERVMKRGLFSGQLTSKQLAGYMRAYAQNLASSRMGADDPRHFYGLLNDTG